MFLWRDILKKGQWLNIRFKKFHWKLKLLDLNILALRFQFEDKKLFIGGNLIGAFACKIDSNNTFFVYRKECLLAKRKSLP